MSEINWRIGHLDHLESPWGNAGGVVRKLEEVERMAKTGVGWIEAGSYTMEERLGNDRDPETGEFITDPETGEPVKIYYHDPETGESYNGGGMPNEGIDKVEEDIPEMVRIAHANHKKLLVNVAPVTNEPVNESIELVMRAYKARADGVVLNGGCPNVITKDGGRHEILSTNPKALFLVLNGLQAVTEKFKPIYLRTSPRPTYAETKAILQVVEGTRTVSAVLVPNSFSVQIPFRNGRRVLGVKGDTAGRTGPATAEDTYMQAKWAKDILSSSKIDIVRSGGIADWEAGGVKASKELQRSLELGVLAAGTTFYYESADWGGDTDRLLSEVA